MASLYSNAILTSEVVMEKLSAIKILDRAAKVVDADPLSLMQQVAKSTLYNAIVHQMAFSNRAYRS